MIMIKKVKGVKGSRTEQLSRTIMRNVCCKRAKRGKR